MQRVVIPGFRKIETGGGGGTGGVSSYNDLTDLPSVGGVLLKGAMTVKDLHLTDDTLTEEGVPADSKKVGDKLVGLVHYESLDEQIEDPDDFQAQLSALNKRVAVLEQTLGAITTTKF